MKKKLTQKRLKELLHYDPDTGVFTWCRKVRRMRKDSIAGSISPRGYKSIFLLGYFFRCSRLAFLYMEGYIPEHEVDHIDRNPSNDKWSNLRHVTRSCNLMNRCKPKNNVSGVVGVCFNKEKGKWTAQINAKGKRYHLGYFKSLVDAVNARYNAEKEHGYDLCNSNTTASGFMNGIK